MSQDIACYKPWCVRQRIELWSNELARGNNQRSVGIGNKNTWGCQRRVPRFLDLKGIHLIAELGPPSRSQAWRMAPRLTGNLHERVEEQLMSASAKNSLCYYPQCGPCSTKVWSHQVFLHPPYLILIDTLNLRQRYVHFELSKNRIVQEHLFDWSIFTLNVIVHPLVLIGSRGSLWTALKDFEVGIGSARDIDHSGVISAIEHATGLILIISANLEPLEMTFPRSSDCAFLSKQRRQYYNQSYPIMTGSTRILNGCTGIG